MFSIRLKSLREDAHLSQAQLAIKLGVGQSTVAMWENGTNMPQNAKLEALASLFSVSTDYLLGLSDITREPTEQQGKDFIKIPVLGTVPAGVPLEAITDILDWEEIPLEMARGGKEYFAIQVHGNSMYPIYEDGDVLIVRKQANCETGQDVIAMTNGDDATLKRFKRTDRGILLQAINPDYESYPFTDREVKSLPVTILGVVVELRRKM